MDPSPRPRVSARLMFTHPGQGMATLLAAFFIGGAAARADAQEDGAAAHVAAPAPAEVRFTREMLVDAARRRAEQDYVPDRIAADAPLAKLGYDQLRAIRFRADRRIWADAQLGFALDLLHLGGNFRTPVHVHLVEGDRTTEVPFVADLFDYGAVDPGIAAGLNAFSGFRVRHALNRPDHLDEFLVFQGASYFRSLGRGQSFGLSARGLAIGTGSADGEEFPEFTAFWIVRPPADATGIVLHALLESASLTGAYTFVARPGEETEIEVVTTLFPRRGIDTVGIAPLTSMFLFNGVNRARFDDPRDAVHDSDGLQIVTGAGERLWRPLNNPKDLQISSFADQNPHGFGLVQRRRGFARFGDLEARYDLRPSAWVEPIGDWGTGAVVLVEIPTANEFNDNIVAFWRPAEPLEAGESMTLSYRLRFGERPPDVAALARVFDTRKGLTPNTQQPVFVIDFEPRPGGSTEPSLEVGVSAGTVHHADLRPLPGSDRLRATIEFEPGDARLAEFRVRLTANGEAVSETWLHRWTR